jgi:hypothetical protein
MKTVLIVLALVISCIAVLLAREAGQMKVGRPGYDPLLEAMYKTHLSPTGTLAIVRQPPPANFHRGRLRTLPSYNRDSPAQR